MISTEDVLRIASLARLSLTENEVVLYQKHLGRVLDYIKDLESVDTLGVGLATHVPTDSVAFREDKAVDSHLAAALIKLAPEHEAGHFIVPAVMDADQ